MHACGKRMSVIIYHHHHHHHRRRRRHRHQSVDVYGTKMSVSSLHLIMMLPDSKTAVGIEFFLSFFQNEITMMYILVKMFRE